MGWAAMSGLWATLDEGAGASVALGCATASQYHEAETRPPPPQPGHGPRRGGQHSTLAGNARSHAMNIMEIDGYKAVIAYDPDINLFRGGFIELNGGADF